MQTKIEFTAAFSFLKSHHCRHQSLKAKFSLHVSTLASICYSAAESTVALTEQTSSTAQVTQVSLFTGLLNHFWLSVLLYCISNFFSKIQHFPMASYLIFQCIFTMSSGETAYWTHPSSLSGAAFPPVGEGQVLSDALQIHKKQEIFGPAKDENSYLTWHMTPTPE